MNSDPELIRGKLAIIRNRLRFLEDEEHDFSLMSSFTSTMKWIRTPCRPS